ncbi:hypothetical protein BJV74DRAFT_839675 [Russula compacta]|nr:hypothetical protein BJV74DRAFT_839675 [Russula compacta]
MCACLLVCLKLFSSSFYLLRSLASLGTTPPHSRAVRCNAGARTRRRCPRRRRHLDVADDVRVNELTLILSLQLLAGNPALKRMTCACCKRRGFAPTSLKHQSHIQAACHLSNHLRSRREVVTRGQEHLRGVTAILNENIGSSTEHRISFPELL